MRTIAVVVPEMLPVPAVRGGAVEHWVQEVCEHLSRPDQKIVVISRPAHVAGNPVITYLAVPWTPIETWFHALKERVTWRNPLRYMAKIQNVYAYATRVAKLVQGSDVVYLHNEPNILLFLKSVPRQKIVLHMHNDHLSSRLFRPFYRRALAKADRILCVSDYIRRSALAAFPEYKDKFGVIVNATNPEVFKPYGPEAVHELEGLVKLNPLMQYVLYVGRLNKQKGVHVLIEAFRSILLRLPNTRLIITGSSFFSGAATTSYERTLVDLAAPVASSIVFTGFLPHEKLKYLYSAVDVVCLPSVWQDPCPLVVLEAMSSGTCLVASRVGGVPEMATDGVTAVLVPPADAEALGAAVCSVLCDPVRKAKMEVAARSTVAQHFCWERLVSELEAELGALK